MSDRTPEPMPVESLIWACNTVLGYPEESKELELDERHRSAIEQATTDAVAAGCPLERADVVGVQMTSYRGSLRMLAELVTLEHVESANAARQTPSFATVINGLEELIAVLGDGLKRSEEMIAADLVAAGEKAAADFHQIMVLAHAHRDLES